MSNIWFKWIKAILDTCDNSDGQITLFRKGVETAYIQPQTKDYWGLKDVVHELKWEDYPEPSGYDENDNPYYLLWYGDIALVFDDFKESWNLYEKERIYARDNLVNLGKKGKIKYWDDWGVYIGHCPLCSEVAYEHTHCVFCGCEFEKPTEEEIRAKKEANHEIKVTKGNVTLYQVCNSLYEFRNGNLVSHSTLDKPLTKEEILLLAGEEMKKCRDMIKDINRRLYKIEVNEDE